MKHIVILGSSPAGAKAVEEIRGTDSSSEITIIAFDGHYPYKRDSFASFISKEITPEKVFYQNKDFYERHNVKLVVDQKIARINFKRKKIFMEDKTQYNYDILIITDTPENRYPDIRGTNKENVYGYKKLKDIDQINNALPVVKTIVIQSNRFTGLEAAFSFVKREKEVLLVTSENGIFNKYFDAQTNEWLTEKFKEKGLRILQGNQISEILGDREAKAVRLESGKVFSAEIIIFIETDEDLRLFSESLTTINKKIEVNAEFKASADSVFAVDQACRLSGPEPVTPRSVLEEQGSKVAAVINGQEKIISMPIYSWSCSLGDIITVLGDIDTEGATVQRNFDPETGAYKGIYIKDNCLVGAVLINKEDEKDGLLKSIQDRLYLTVPQQDQGEVGESGTECSLVETNEGNVSTELVDN